MYFFVALIVSFSIIFTNASSVNPSESSTNAGSNNGSLVTLFEAIQSGNVDDFQKIIQSENINAADENGNTALHTAAENGNEKIAELLIQMGANVDIMNNAGETPLQWACALNTNETVVDLLIRNGADVNHKTHVELLVLHYAAMNENEKITESLLRSGACSTNFTRTYMNSFSPIDVAILNLNEKVAKAFIRNGENISVNLFPVGGLNKNEKVVDLFIKNGVNMYAVDDTGKTVLHVAAEHSREKTVDLLIQKGINVSVTDYEGNTALHMAALNDRLKEVTQTSKEDAKRWGTFIKYVTDHFRHKQVTDSAQNIKSCKKTIELLIKNGANVNHRNNQGNTPLHLALLHDNDEIIELLIENGANVTLRNEQRYTENDVLKRDLPQFNKLSNHGYFLNHPKIYEDKIHEFLRENGVYEEHEDGVGTTPLQLANLLGKTEVAALLKKASKSNNNHLLDITST